MDRIRKITRLSIFIDYDNFTISYRNKFGLKQENIAVWDNLCDQFCSYYSKYFITNDFEVVDHVGTFLCVGLSEDLYLEDEEIRKQLNQRERAIRKRFRSLDRKNGFIIKYGGRQKPYIDEEGKVHFGKEKGVDAEIICQMLMGSFLDHYDACIIFSDDADYIPAITRIQDYFGKKVIQAGYVKGRLREQAYGNIPLEDTDSRLIMEADD